jgi:NitT/TauT family transport system substrate-binding protein
LSRVASLTVTLTVALAALTAAACDAPRPLRVGGTIWPGYEPLYLAAQLGAYGPYGVILQDFPSASDVARAYTAGLLDVAALTGDEALSIANRMPGHTIILVCDFSNGADAVVARPPAASMTDLRGRRVGYEQGATGSYLLSRALDAAGMQPEEIILVPLRLPEHTDAYTSNRVDAVVTFEPQRSSILALGGVVVFDSSRIPGEIVDVLITRQDTIAARGESLQALVDGWFRGLNFLRTRPREAAAALVGRSATSVTQFSESLRLLDVQDRAANVRLLGPTGGLRRSLDQLEALMIARDFLERRGQPLLVDDRFVRRERR